MRCLALAQAWQDEGGRAMLLTAECPQALMERLRGEGVHILAQEAPAGTTADADATVEVARRHAVDWVVLDGYHFDPVFHQRVSAGGKRLLAIDDGFPFTPHSADAILNQNLHACETMYPPRAGLLLGPRYLLLRREFIPWRDRARQVVPLARRLLVTLGGADPGNTTLKAIHSLHHLPAGTFEATVLVGSANPHRDALVRAARACSSRVEVRPAADDMPALLASADMAVTAGGTTTWEMAFMGLPAAVVALADNQKPVADAAAEHGCALDLGWHAELTPEGIAAALGELSVDQASRQRMARAGQELIDGQGVERVLQHLLGERLRLRRTRPADASLLWQWANDPEVRSRGFHPQAIPWVDHLRWLEDRLRSPDAFLFVGVDAGDLPVGQVRLDRTAPGEAVVSVSVAAVRRGGGWGTDLIEAATSWGHRHLRLETVHAYIKPDNAASLRAFCKAGYTVVGQTRVKDQPAVHAVHEDRSCARAAG
jgi:UDP-2,4-diacetamido-2,4,6-trideoxy-beta-L-altropyranose hydrolase